MTVSLKKPTVISNSQRISRMMSHSHYGAMKQAFIMEAIAKYSEQQIAAEPWSERSIISQATWKAIAQECLDDLKVCP